MEAWRYDQEHLDKSGFWKEDWRDKTYGMTRYSISCIQKTVLIRFFMYKK